MTELLVHYSFFCGGRKMRQFCVFLQSDMTRADFYCHYNYLSMAISRPFPYLAGPVSA